MPRIAPPNPVERRMSRFLREPPSVRTAASVIVTATATVVVVGGLLMRFLDHDEYATILGGHVVGTPDGGVQHSRWASGQGFTTPPDGPRRPGSP